MTELVLFSIIVYIVQVIHSLEELSTSFHSRWYLVKLSFRLFLGFEILHNLFWLAVLTISTFPQREELLAFFLILMFANGIQHLVWAGVEKRYVPGLISALLHIVLFLVFFFRNLF